MRPGRLQRIIGFRTNESCVATHDMLACGHEELVPDDAEGDEEWAWCSQCPPKRMPVLVSANFLVPLSRDEADSLSGRRSALQTALRALPTVVYADTTCLTHDAIEITLERPAGGAVAQPDDPSPDNVWRRIEDTINKFVTS